jgi:hypothetical protein
MHSVYLVDYIKEKKKKKNLLSQMLVADTCNPSYSGGRDQENLGLNCPGKQFLRSYLENTQHKRGLAEWLNWVQCLTSQV